ncbi:MAG TPA: hypothetical protein VGO63_01215 [Candidatus Paceibacterota bacterium]|jgi:hypothetical protein|nr:hypothetical protein [Candidatus Paceibacterota bacterium]
MPIIEIHGKQVHIPEGSHSAKEAAHFLGKYKDNAEDIFEAAHHAHGGLNGVTHFTLPPKPGYHGAHEFVLRHDSDGTYHLRKKDTGFLAS